MPHLINADYHVSLCKVNSINANSISLENLLQNRNFSQIEQQV